MIPLLNFFGFFLITLFGFLITLFKFTTVQKFIQDCKQLILELVTKFQNRDQQICISGFKLDYHLPSVIYVEEQGICSCRGAVGASCGIIMISKDSCKILRPLKLLNNIEAECPSHKHKFSVYQKSNGEWSL